MLHCIPVGSLSTNCYILIDDETGEALAVDCAVFDGEYQSFIRGLGIRELKYILLTHGHFDHISGVRALKEAFGGKVCIHAEDSECLFDETKSLNAYVDYAPLLPSKADIILTDGLSLDFGNGEIKVMHTPGHTKGSVCFFIGNMMFSGDTLFKLSMGRTDMPGGSTRQMFSSLRAIGQLEGDYEIYSGHGEKTNLSFEKANNRYLRAK
ncbi:MAG: MBL fold metallo-hydrolase [Oscillospiraceae bacterium]|nr:MBL fold metallo-hydrolase [Oscillospiraceae bacterium]